MISRHIFNSDIISGNILWVDTIQSTGNLLLADDIVQIQDKNIDLGAITSPSDANADQGGITLLGSSNKTIKWLASNQSWNLNQHLSMLPGLYVETEKVKALNNHGLKLEDQSGNGMHVTNGGHVIFSKGIDVSGSSTFLSDVDFLEGIGVSGLSTFLSGVNVSGPSTFLSDVDFLEGIGVSGLSTFLSGVNVSGSSTFLSGVNVSGPSTFLSGVNVSGPSTFLSDVDFLEGIGVSGLSTFLSGVNVSGPSTFLSEVNVSGSSTFLSGVNVSGPSTFLSDVDFSGGFSFNGNQPLEVKNGILNFGLASGLPGSLTGNHLYNISGDLYWNDLNLGGGTISIGETFPDEPKDGDLFYDETVGILYIYIEEIDAWIQTNGSANTDVDVSLDNLKLKLGSGLGNLTIGDSADIITIPGNLNIIGDTTYSSGTIQVVENNILSFSAGDGNSFEIQLTAQDATSDKTIFLPNKSGVVATLDDIPDLIGEANIPVTSTAPTSPDEGDTWYDSANETLYIYLGGTTNNWVQAGGVAAGQDTEIQYNNSGSFGSSNNLTFDGSFLTAGGLISKSSIVSEANLEVGPGISGFSFIDLKNNIAADLDIRIAQGALSQGQSQNDLYISAGSGQQCNVSIQGDLTLGGDVVAFSSSDKNLKNNISNISSPIEKIKQINGVNFDWSNNQTTYTGKDVGVIAQEVEKVIPEAVARREDGYLGVKYERIIPLLIEAIKDQQNQIEELKSKLP